MSVSRRTYRTLPQRGLYKKCNPHKRIYGIRRKITTFFSYTQIFFRKNARFTYFLVFSPKIPQKHTQKQPYIIPKTELYQHSVEFFGDGGFEADLLLCGRMDKGQHFGMQTQTVDRRIFIAVSILAISHHRMP